MAIFLFRSLASSFERLGPVMLLHTRVGHLLVAISFRDIFDRVHLSAT